MVGGTTIRLMAVALSLAMSLRAEAECPSILPALSFTAGSHSSTVRSALLRGFDNSNPQALQAACRPSSVAVRAEAAVQARITRMATEPNFANAARVGATMTSTDSDSGIAPRLELHWRKELGPSWVANVPDWVIDNARNYHRRGLPLVHLWDSPHYLVAVGLSNHGVPGVYFSQKLP
jgi:hypothetical protein